jgi:hypothetical protein
VESLDLYKSLTSLVLFGSMGGVQSVAFRLGLIFG